MKSERKKYFDFLIGKSCDAHRNKNKNKILGIFHLFAKYQPMYYLFMVPLVLVSSVIPLIGVWFPKLIIEFLTEKKEYREVLAVIGAYIVILAAANILKNILAFQVNIRVSRLKFQLQLEIGKAAMNAEIKNIENAVYKEEILMAGNITGLAGITDILQNLFSAAITILGLIWIIVRVNFLFFLLVGGTVGLKVILSMIRFRREADQRLKEAENNKIGGYLDFLQYYCEGAAKELRVNNAQNWLFGKISDFREKMLAIQMKSFRRYQLFEAFQRLAVAIQNICILLALSSYYLKGSISIADFSLYFSSITLLSVTLSKVTDEMLNFNQKLLSCGDYNKIVEMETNKNFQVETDRDAGAKTGQCSELEMDLGETAAMQRTVPDKIKKIRFENVSFSYPGAAKKVLENISFELGCGDRAMLVGVNGSGKTTIIKLLCKFYRPDSGKIYVNDIDIDIFPAKQYYSLIATVFQDFSLFSFRVDENITMEQSENHHSNRLWDCLKKVEMEERIRNLKEKENTYITRLFSESGVDFSGGERQRLGIARAVFKAAQILILDEPAASLDVKMEDELYQKFYDMTKDKISLTVSHRLSQASTCNKIYVLDQGVICEQGTHHELMQKNGIYAAMFKKQREAYIMG